MLTLNDGRSELWQWDTGRTLAVDADCSQVHFSNKVFGRSIDVDVIDGSAIIPDVLLQTDKELNVWAFVGKAENGYTKISKTFKVNRRNKPADYVFTPPDQTSLEEIKEKIDYLESIQDPDAIKNAVGDYLEKNPVEAPVQSVNGQTGEVKLTAEDVGAISDETDPTVPAWAKQPQKPTYTADEVHALPDTYTPPNQTAQQVGADPAGAAASAVSQHNTDETAHNDLRLALQGLSDRIDSALDSDDTTLDQMSEVVAYIKSNKTLIDAITTSKVSVADIVNDLVTNVAGKPLSAAQGVALKQLIDELRTLIPEAYTLPVATETILGGVKPVTATEAMTQPVGITADGKLVTVPSPDSGGNADHVSVEPADDDVPKVFLTGSEFGNMTTSKNEVNMGLEYISKTDKFSAAIKIKFQGNSSLDYPKKNFTIKMYTDDSYGDKLKKSFRDWNHSGNKYVLKANYIDHAHARNIISANLWSEVVASRPDYDTLPVEMRNSPRNGAIDGFPVKLYVNGTYQGIYTWNIGKDAWMWCMDEGNANHVLMCAETNDNGSKNSTPCNFRALWSGTDENHWTVEVGTNSTAVKTALNNLIQFVMNNDGEDFRNGIGEYLDIQSAIDYYIFMYDVCGLDGLAKNMLLATYDGRLWRCGAYDMDSTFGLFWNGSKFVAATYRCPEDYQETNSLLWERIEANFLPELKARQAELRKTVLSYANIVTHFERFMDVIGLDLYAEDLTIYTGIPSGSTNNIKQIRNYVRDRQAYVDAEFAAMALPVPCTGISLSANNLTFTAEGTQTLTATVTPDGCTDEVTWESDNTSVATVSGGVVTAVANGDATITAKCGEYSASCSVAVSGIAEPKPCTGITLDKSELTFDGEGTQTITATVTPSDTTDTVVWVSSAPDVASITVTGNICTVQSVRNGGATITVTCGEYSASCSVSVSGIELSEPYYSWSDENIYEINADGTVTETSDKYITNLFDVPYGSYRIVNNTGKQVWGYLAQYDSDGNFVGGAEFNGLVNGGRSGWISVCEDLPSKLRIAAHIKDGIVLERSDGIWSEIACYDAPKTGAIQYLYNNYRSSFMTQKKIAVEGGKSYTLANKNGGAFEYKGVAEYKADGSFVKFEQQGGITTPYTTTLDAETAYVYLIAGNSTDPNNCLEFTMVE